MMQKTRKTKRTTYEWEPELQGLGSFKSGCSADSLKGQSKKKKGKTNLTCNFQRSRLRKQHLHG